MDPVKVQVVVKWGKSSTVTEIKSFLGLAGYYCKLIKGFLSIVAPFTRLTKKNTKFEYNDDCENSFNQLK